jgi:YD repeat-containing protein
MVATASEAIAAMQEANILVPVVKRTTVKDGALVEEEMTEYVTIPKEGGCYYAPEKIMVRSDNNDNYQVRKEMESAIIGEDSCLPIGVTEKGMHTALLHDRNSKWCVLQATDVSADKVLAVDCRHYRQKNFANGSDMMGRILFLAEKMQEGIDNYNPESIRLDSYQEFRSTVFYQYGKSFLEVLGKGTDDVCAAITAMLDTCSTDVHMGTEEYISWQIRLAYDYFPMTGNDSNWDMSLEEMQELGALLMEELYMNDGRNLLEYLQTFDGSLRSGADFEPYTLTTLLEQPNYMLYVVPIRTDVCVTYTINHSGGTAEGTVELFGVTPGVLQCVCLDLSGYNHVTGITVTEFGTLQHLTLVPEGAEFEAVSYNADGTVALKYNQDGQMQYYEYDNAGRLIRVRDENGETLDTSDYHVKNTTF